MRDRHAARVQSDRREEAGVAERRVQNLSDVRFRIAVAESFLPHHFLA